MMARHWPSPLAQKNDPVVAVSMNSRPKIVFSKNLARALWNNTRLVKGDLASGNPQAEKGRRQAEGDFGKRQYCFAIGRGTAD